MPRTKGALNKQTRIALTAAAEGKLADGAEHTLALVMGIANDPTRDDAIRLQAANVALPYVRPRLASIEQRHVDDAARVSEQDILAQLKALVTGSPSVIDALLRLIMDTDPTALERALARKQAGQECADKALATGLH
jgi:hypothetical protein